MSRRLAPQLIEIIDRSQTVTFKFDGQTYTAYPGDTIASALAAANVHTLSRSFKYHRPRGLLCCAGHCPNCLVQVGGEMNVRACTEPVQEGMTVRPQNVWPSLNYDLMALTALGDRFLPVGFYYKTFIRPQFLWPVYEHFLRHAAGLGEVKPDTPWDQYDKQYLHADVVVIGGGPAGMSAAVAAVAQGARVLLFDDQPHPGGHTRYTRVESDQLAVIREQLAVSSNLKPQTWNSKLETHFNSTILGWWEDNWLAGVCGRRLYKIRAQAVVIATGAYEQPLLFDNNDLPGILLGSAVQRLLHLYGVAPGQRAVVITANDEGWQVAADLLAAGVQVLAVADEQPGRENQWVAQIAAANVPIYWGHTIRAATGRSQVKGAILTPIPVSPKKSAQDKLTSCDLIALSVAWTPASGLLYQAGGKLAYQEAAAEFRPNHIPPKVFVAGRVNGTYNLEAALTEGEMAGRNAAAYTGYGQPAPPINLPPEPRRSSTQIIVPGQKKQFLCYCEDVTAKDLQTAIAEGYDSIELLKRYSTISMGPCQGKLCSANTVHLCARANEQTIEQTGTTTARPPMTPVKLGVLAGQTMEPVSYTPIHDWHEQNGGKMMVAGLWLRPEHYGDPVAEVQAVRQRVGLIDVSTLGKLRFTGPGVPRLLDRIYSNKWQKLERGRVRYGIMCNDEGVILDDGVTARVGEQEWYTTVTSSGATSVYEYVQWWLQSGWGEGVHLTNVTEGNAAFNLAGPQARAVLQTLTQADVSNQAFPYLHVRDLTLARVPCRVMRLGFTGELAYEIHCPASYGLYLWQTILAAGEAHGIRPFGVEAQRVLRLEKAHIIVGQDTDALSDPIAADMGWAVKLDKESFLGQRPLTRITKEGPKQKLVGFTMINPQIVPDEGLQIVRPNPDSPLGLEIIGWVTSSRFSPTLNQAIGLCWLPVSLAEQPGTPFTIRMNGKLVEACVHHGPFYDPEGVRLRG